MNTYKYWHSNGELLGPKKGTVGDQYSNLRLKLSLFPQGPNNAKLRMSGIHRRATTRGINNKVFSLVVIQKFYKKYLKTMQNFSIQRPKKEMRLKLSLFPQGPNIAKLWMGRIYRIATTRGINN